MKTMTEAEIDQFIESLKPYLGWELQGVLFNDKALQLKLYHEGTEVWLVFSMKPGVPFLCLSQERLFLVKKLKKPLALFVSTHFMGEKLESITRIEKLGRVVEITFSGEKVLELSLVTGRVNVLAQVGNKRVFAFRPKDIAEKIPNDFDRELDRPLRDNTFFLDQWQSFNIKTKKETPKDLSKMLKKKQAGLAKMEEKLKQLKVDLWKLSGDWLKSNQTLENVPEDLTLCVDRVESLAWNIENCFSQSKKNRSKIEGTESRVQELQLEIKKLEGGEWKAPSSKGSKKNLLGEAKLKGKTIALPCGRIFIGKSGAENLQLLRKAKPWYYWLHIKDYPGAHGIIEVVKKNSKLDMKSLEKGARAVVRQSLPKNQTGSFEVIYCECRYVRPIKGAKSGQVTYSHETVVSIKV